MLIALTRSYAIYTFCPTDIKVVFKLQHRCVSLLVKLSCSSNVGWNDMILKEITLW